MNILSNFPKNDNKNNVRTGPGYYIPIAVVITLLLIGFFWLGYLMISIPEYFGEMEELKGEPIPKVIEVEEKEVEPEPEKEPVIHLTDDDIIAAVVMAEARNQEMVGKVAVAMTVLNRCDCWGASVETIVSAPNQYSYPYTGEITPEAYEAVRIARENRNLFPKGMMWFLPSGYPEYGHPYMQIQGHYFSYFTDEEVEEIQYG